MYSFFHVYVVSLLGEFHAAVKPSGAREQWWALSALSGTEMQTSMLLVNVLHLLFHGDWIFPASVFTHRE